MIKIAFIATLALLAKVAFAADGHFEIPNWVQPQGQPTAVAGGFQVNGPAGPGSCADKPAALAFLQGWKQRARQGYAQMVAKHIPSLTPGASCIKAPEAIDAKYEVNGDFFTVTCLAQTRGRLTHLFKMELLVEPAECLSDAKISEFVNSQDCQSKGEIDRFISLAMSPCPVGAVPPRLRSGNASYPIDPAFFANLLNNRPSIRNIVEEDRRVKIGSGGGDNTDGGTGKDCNAAGCWPESNNSRDVK